MTTDTPTHRHKKRGTEYVLIGYGRMQAENGWCDMDANPAKRGQPWSVDMREVAIYRSVDDGSLWVRPREEFEDGRFEVLPVPASVTGEAPTQDQVKYMAEQFLRWKLPETFNPDGGISFESSYREFEGEEIRREPSGTNLLDYTQAKAMVEYMLDGLPDAALPVGKVEPDRYSEMEKAAIRLYNYVGRDLKAHGPNPKLWGEQPYEHRRKWRDAVRIVLNNVAPPASERDAVLANDDLAWIMDAELAPTQGEIYDAGNKWCGDKDRETFASDHYYFRENWRALDGLKAYVAREISSRVDLAIRRQDALRTLKRGGAE